MPSLFTGVADFYFPSEVAVVPGLTYFFEPVVQAGGLWNIDSAGYDYLWGTAFAHGNPLPGSDLWFREGIVIPEPASWVLLLAGIGWLLRRGLAK